MRRRVTWPGYSPDRGRAARSDRPAATAEDRVRGINHLDEFWAADTNNPRQAAMS